ncbi:hypothetical protein QJS66_01635 [Kocuria rhizophila]|nr:hypothetical protein QJS66_01635 [Kocuria rhizophila]
MTRQARGGGLRQRLQDAEPGVHGVRDRRVKAWTTRAWADSRIVCCRTAGRTRRRCPTTSCAWTTTSTRCARTPPLRRRSGSPEDTSWAAHLQVAAELAGAEAIAPTTTPWTPPTNEALVVGPAIDYVLVPGAGEAGRTPLPRGRRTRGSYARTSATGTPRTRPPQRARP